MNVGVPMRPSSSAATGFTLIELVITIVVVAIALMGVMSVYINIVRHSADPVIARQGIALAEAYLEEILAKSFPDPAAACAARPFYDSAHCYFGLVESPVRSDGNAIPSLAAYTVEVAAGGSCGLGLGAGEQRIDVRVSHPAGFDYELSGCMTNYR